MSRVCLIAADKPLPLCDRQSERTSTVRSMGKDFTITALRGFRVAEHRYYRAAVELLGYPMKPYQYELELEQHPDDLAHLLEYLRTHELAELKKKAETTGKAKLARSTALGALFFGIVMGGPECIKDGAFNPAGLLHVIGMGAMWGILFYLMFTAMLKLGEKRADKEVQEAEHEE